ncbi:MAG: hypothetical protein Q9191_005232 [Dirinaria sp. TL-2023a]
MSDDASGAPSRNSPWPDCRTYFSARPGLKFRGEWLFGLIHKHGPTLKLFLELTKIRNSNYPGHCAPPTALPISDANQSQIIVRIPNTVDTIDLSKPFNNTNELIWSHIAKNGSNHDSTPPTLNDGTIFSDGSSLYLFGGGISVANPPVINAPKSTPTNGVWQYEFGSGQWNMATLSGDAVQRMTLGMSVQSSSHPTGYYLGGVKLPAADPYFWTVPGATPYMDQGLLTFDESSVNFQNDSTTGLNDFGTLAEGFLALIESVGSKGVLVAFGGFSNAAAKAMNVTDDQLLSPSLHRNLSTISIYDIDSQTWFQQTATGDVPRWRYIGCSVLVSAPDQSSHSIYVYAGWGGTFEGSDGDVYVLSIPSFQWIRVNNENHQRSRHHCSLIGNNTMLVVGGIAPFNDFPIPTWTSSGCDQNNSIFAQGVGIFSLNNHSWTTAWDPEVGAEPYLVHPSISKVIGGGPSGGATLQGPEHGFSQQALQHLFQPTLPGDKNNATDPRNVTKPIDGKADKKKLSAGTVTGIAVGSVMGLALFLALALFLVLHRRRKTRPHNVQELSDQNFRRELASGEDKVAGVHQVWRSELDDGVEKVAELCSTPITQKPLPMLPQMRLLELSKNQLRS